MEISITRGLSELKLLDKRIQKGINETTFITSAIGQKPVSGYTATKEYEQNTEKNHQSIVDLIKRRQIIKSQIVESNAKTKVTISSKSMTVAEAIERKTSIQYDKLLLEKMRRDYIHAVNQVESKNEEVQLRLDKLLEANFGKDSKVKDSEMDAISKPFKEQNEAKLVDPLKLKEKIDTLSKEIDEFESEVDFILSESNTITKIHLTE
ncbi:hypothetical protein BRE01_62290 [Brevibacillus reuszeri]|uniref:Uncharacterized protein n=1 Tax=Brevibacillus reuszeri TaxID=54915 RepID=A0A0K9YW78_9BACL|nr:hypothetical protein [Brevibacillus reuszeri]KNB72926.1 hypothetical protein ADS79_13955 [Brevibacillus reuszeri]GED72527.1 hypothetical protein BRE01_62290 [Brevibacillus reuszeri]